MMGPEDSDIRKLAEVQPVTEQDRVNVFLQIQRMSVAERLKLAMLGNKEVRGILIRDPNRAVQTAVLANPRITETEIERVASSKIIDDEVLRLIIANREWVKKYAIKVALTGNPKTPLKESMRLLPHLRDKDLSTVARSRNLPNVVVMAAKKLLAARKG
jgi:hypothetical protein